MTHGFIALSSAAMTAYFLIPTTVDGGYHFGLFAMAVASGIAALILESLK